MEGQKADRGACADAGPSGNEIAATTSTDIRASIDFSRLLPDLKAGQRRSVILFEKLVQVQEKLKKKEEECEVLTKEQMQTGEEVQDFTALLFEEANKMIQEAHVKKVTAEKELADAHSKIEILQAEVIALKKIIISTTNCSNFSITPPPNKINSMTNFIKGHKRSTSHHNFVKVAEFGDSSKAPDSEIVDSYRFDLFKCWRENPQLNEDLEFIKDLMEVDICPCLKFLNFEILTELKHFEKQLGCRVKDAIFLNNLSIEPLNKHALVGQCSLLQKEMVCEYVIKFEGSPDVFAVSKFARNRIIAVCDLMSYLRYITLGLVKTDELDTFNEVLQRLKQVALARLGLKT